MADAGGNDHHVAGLHFLLNASPATEAYGGGTTKTTESLVRLRMVMWAGKHRCAPVVAPLVGVKGFFDQLRRHIVECAGIKQERQLGIVRDAAVVLEEETRRLDGVDTHLNDFKNAIRSASSCWVNTRSSPAGMREIGAGLISVISLRGTRRSSAGPIAS